MMIGALIRRTIPPAQTSPPPGKHDASIRAWVANCWQARLALETYVEGPYHRCQTVPHSADNQRRELGEAVAQAIGRENSGASWHRQDEIIATALSATGTSCFMDYLVAIGEVDFREGT